MKTRTVALVALIYLVTFQPPAVRARPGGPAPQSGAAVLTVTNGLPNKALTEHTVGTAKTDIYGKASFPAVPAGTYYVYGTANQFVKTGAAGTVSGNTVTLNDTGYQAATIWNLKVAVKAGPNAVTLTPDNAAFAGN